MVLEGPRPVESPVEVLKEAWSVLRPSRHAPSDVSPVGPSEVLSLVLSGCPGVVERQPEVWLWLW